MTSQCGQCDRPIYARGLCSAHYQRFRYQGTLDDAASPPEQRICAQCGVPFTPKTRAARTAFCSTVCKDAAMASKRPPKARGNDGVCVECGASLAGLRADARYCSERCRHLKHVGPGVRPRTALPNTGSCHGCGTPLTGKKVHARWCGAARCRNLWHLYKITATEVDAFLSQQGGGCAICGTTDWGNGGTPAVDHCHGSGRVRGILCVHCNAAIGQVNDDPARLRAAAEYLERAVE
jgi:hypothetical protein